MSIRHFIHTVISIAAIAMTALLLPSCAEERFAVPDYTVSGEDVTLSVPLLIPQMPESTRGDLSPNQLNKVESLWIRTYNAETKEATCDWLKLTPNTADVNNMREVTLTTKSGFSYIVAVANVEHMGISGNLPAEGGLPQLKPLSDLLEAADTWDKFLQIAVPAPSDEDDVNAPQSNTLPMAGCYSDATVTAPNKEPVSLDTWQTADFQPYFIPASKDEIRFEGGIHLRRLVSHITFNFFAGEDIDLTVNSYQVMNAPKYTWLYERNEEMTTVPNYGDQATTAAEAKRYYADVPQYGSQFIKDGKPVDGKTPQTFDFWQAENKHTSKDCSTYADRGLKKKDDSDLMLFTSLTGETWTAANEASYVVVDCDITYRHSIKVDEDGAVVENGTPVDRSGHATYFIHLGYILGADEAAKAKDFNCFRNVNYTYNVTVNGLDDIRVDATADIEKYHGEEGLVVDLHANPINIDAHYAVFNIYLSEDDLKENFGFIITTYDNGEQITINETNPRVDNGNGKIVIYEDKEKKKPIDSKYYNWIELRATTGPDDLALYKPRVGPNVATVNPTFLLSDLYTYQNAQGQTTLYLPDNYKSETGWYTVFVNEYTYEPMYGDDDYGLESGRGADGRPTWMHYVNQNPRRFYIKVSYRESPDGNSVYARSKYAVQQQSLMTYYSQINVDPEGTAIAVERENETFGLNLRFRDNSGGSSQTNGRWNAAQYLTTGEDVFYTVANPWGSISVTRPNDNQKSTWARFLEMSQPLEVPAVTDNLRLQGGPEIKARTIANNNPHKLRKIKTDPDSPAKTNFTDPQTDPQYNIKAMSAFVNRNRDNNGNGKIDAEELRWYIPTMTRYVLMTLGANAMPQRLMQFDEIKQLPFVTGKNGYSMTSGEISNSFYNRYMYIASNYAPLVDGNQDNNVLWALEGTSLSKFQQVTNWSTGKDSNSPVNPWEIRCVRNLGSNLKTVQVEDKVTMPFIHSSGSRILNMKYFNLAAIRTTQLTGNGPDNTNYMPVHTINSSYNSVYAGLEYADRDLDYNKPTNATAENFSQYILDYINENPCKEYGQPDEGWRVPNQIELTMLYLAGVLIPKQTGWLSSTVQYINANTGVGNDLIQDKLFMVSASSHTLLLTWDNYRDNAIRDLKVRCVRDIQP